jgi:predicted metal-binding protein
MECGGSQRNLAAIAHKVADSSAVSVAGVTLCALLQPSWLHVSQNTTEVRTADGMHAVSLSNTHALDTTSCPFTETLNTNKVKHG